MKGEEAVDEGEDHLPVINISEASSVSKTSEQQQDLDKLVLPKILNRMKAFRSNTQGGNMNGLSGDRRYFGRNMLTVPGEDMLRRDDQTAAHHHPSLPGYSSRPLNGPTNIEMIDQTDYKSRFPVRPGKRLKLNQDPFIDSERRKSILKELQRRRVNLNKKEIFATLPFSEPDKRRSSLASLSHIHDVSPGSYYPSCGSTQDATPEIHLPKIDVYSKLVEPKNTPSEVILVSDGIPGLVADNAVQPVQYYYPMDKDYAGRGVIGERLSQSTSVCVKKDGHKKELDNELMRVLPVDPKLTVDTGTHKWGRSRYGILEVMWTAMNLYENRGEYEGSLVEEQVNNTKQITDEKQHRKKSKNLKYPPMAVKRVLKPIRNRNLVTNPFTNNTEKRTRTRRNEDKNLSKRTYNSECLRSTPSCSISTKSLSKSNQELTTDGGLCTLRELLDIQT